MREWGGCPVPDAWERGGQEKSYSALKQGQLNSSSVDGRKCVMGGCAGLKPLKIRARIPDKTSCAKTARGKKIWSNERGSSQVRPLEVEGKPRPALSDRVGGERRTLILDIWGSKRGAGWGTYSLALVHRIPAK